MDEDGEARRRIRQKTAVAALGKTVEDIDDGAEPDLSSAIYLRRSEASVAASRKVEIDKFINTGCVKDWKIDDAKATGAKILTGVWVDPEHKEKSRWCAREFATVKDPTVFAAASEDVTAAMIDFIFGQAWLSTNGFRCCISIYPGTRGGAHLSSTTTRVPADV